MDAPKTAASLTAGLLARKGHAQPAMRRQSLGGPGPRAIALTDDLGWNDMGDYAEPTPSPVAAHIASIQETLDRPKTERQVEPVPVKAARLVAVKVAAAPPPVAKARLSVERKSAFTLRLDADRHLRLRLLSAVTNRSAQQLLIGAFDALIAQHPEIEALAKDARVSPGVGKTGVTGTNPARTGLK
jgi:hypothetical protein